MTLYGLTIAIAVFTGFFVTLRRAEKSGISRQDIENLFLIAVPFAVIGARLYHVFSQVSYYSKNLVEVFYFWQGGWGIYGAIAGGMLGVFLYTRFKKINFWTILDLTTPGLVLAQAIGRLGNIANGELLPYAIYESILDFLIFLYLFRFQPQTTNHKPQTTFAYYAILYGTGRFFLEFLRTEPEVLWGLRLNQVGSILLVFFGLAVSKVKISNCSNYSN